MFDLTELHKLFPLGSGNAIKNGHIDYAICTDSRKIKEHEIFLPLLGANHDGHDFINDVLSGGAAFSFCEIQKLGKAKEEYRSKLIIVNNTLDAYHTLSNYYRKKVSPSVIAITGSSGKTTIKDLITSVLSTKYKTHKTEANFNNEIGVPKTILEMPNDTEVLVLEMAMRGKGEIKYLSKAAEPDIATIVNVGTAHIGRLGSIDNIVKAKCEILEHVKKDGLVVFYQDPRLAQYIGEQWLGMAASIDLSDAIDINFDEGKTYFTLSANGTIRERYSINALGKVHVVNSLIAILIAKYLGLEKKDIQKGLAKFSLPKGRGNVIKVTDEVYLIDDSYNASPDSLRASVSSLMDCWNKDYKKILVLGELAELGDFEGKLLEELDNWLNKLPLEKVITVGEKLKEIKSSQNVENIDQACAILEELLSPKTVVLVKGSHVAGLEKLIEHFLNNHNIKWRSRS